MAQTIFLTGATGLIGQQLCQRLLAAGHRLRAWVRSPDAAREKLGPKVELVPTSGGESALVQALEGVDWVVNLAGEPVFGRRWTPEVKRSLVASRVDLTQNLVSAMRRAKTPPSVFISASAIGYYGIREDEVVDEKSEPGDDFFGDLCQQWEAAAKPARELGTRLVNMRIGIVLAPKGGALAEMVGPVKLGIAGPLGSGRQYMSWIHIDDIIDMFIQALTDNRVEGPVNATAPNPVRNREMMKAIGRAVHRPVFMPVPGFALRLLKGEMATYLLTGQRVVPAAMQSLGFPFRYPDLESALASLL